MQRNVFLMIAAVITALFGVALLLFPNEIAAVYGTSFNASGVIVARISGASLLALAIMVWGARDGDAAETMRGILLGGLVVNVCDLVVAYLATSSGVWASGIGWAQVVLHILLGAGFAYFLFGKR
jgi:hypothetical protein